MRVINTLFTKTAIHSIRLLLICTVLAGFIYPAAVTLAAKGFHSKAEGSLIKQDGKIVGSELIGQKFEKAIYFHSRPSACDYSTLPSSASNLAPSSAALAKLVADRRSAFASSNSIDPSTVPSDMLYASASGLDPHISPESARMQIHRIAAARNLSADKEADLAKIVASLTENPSFGIFGQQRINVLRLNIETDRMFSHE
jgi:K+-transporting ATPase ATPase C chain